MSNENQNNEAQHDHDHDEDEGQGAICPRMDENCRGGAIEVLGAIIQDYLAAHGTNLGEEKGNGEARKILQEMLDTLPNAETVREQQALADTVPGGVIPEA